MLTRMSDPPNSTSRARPSTEGSTAAPSVLASLPRTRPQRASARRGAARTASARKPSENSRKPSAHSRTAAANSRKPSGKASTKQPRAKPTVESVPMQGYEAEDSLSRPVQPPGGAELVTSVAELAGELAKAGVSTGARLLKDFLSRVPPG